MYKTEKDLVSEIIKVDLERIDRLEKIVFEIVDDTSDILTRLRNLEKAVFGR